MSDDNSKNLPTTQSRDGLVNTGGLNAGSLIDQSLSRLNQSQIQNLVAKAAEEALRLEVKAREQNIDYVGGKKAIEDHVDAFNGLDKRNKLDRHSITSNVKTGAGNMRIESRSGAPTCFVATTAYGDPSHPDVVLLRRFRDEVLVNSAAGRSFVAWYWRAGPKLARAFGWSPKLRGIARGALKGVVTFARMALNARVR